MNVDSSIPMALIPVFAVIVIGYGLRSFDFPGDTFWSHAERLTYFVLFPSLLLQKTATAASDPHAYLLMAGAIVGAVAAMTGLLFLVLPWWSSGKASFTSFFQGSIRFNSYVGFAAAFALFGNSGLTAASLAIAVLIPLLNIICVTLLVVFCGSEQRSWRTVALEIMRNPLVLACLSGSLLNISGIGLHRSLTEILAIFSRAALPLGLLCVGAGLNFSAAKRTGPVVVATCLLKLLVFPAIMWTACRVLGLDTMSTSIAVLFAALPGSPAAFILSKQLGGDSILMASIITIQTPVSMLTLPVVMALVQ